VFDVNLLNTNEQLGLKSSKYKLQKENDVVTKRARKTKSFNSSEPIVDFGKYKKRNSRVTILPKNLAQEDYLTLLDDANKNIVFATGPAGTGKTMLAVLAAVRASRKATVRKLL